MTRAECRTAIRALTYHDSDTQITDAQLNTSIDLKHKQLRRRLSVVAPSLYTATHTQETITGTDDTLTLPTYFDRLVRLERLYGSQWLPVPVSDHLNAHIGSLAMREEGTDIKVDPVGLAPGTYRIVYIVKPVTISTDADAATGTLLVPDGMEEIVVLEVAGDLVRPRSNEEGAAHLAAAERIWRQSIPALRQRYGQHPVPGLRVVAR